MSLALLGLEGYGLISRDSCHLVDILYRGSTAEVIDRGSHTLEDWPYSLGTG